MANLLRNDPTQTVPASNAAIEDVQGFFNATRDFANLTVDTPAMEGASKMAMVRAGERVQESGLSFQNKANPRVDSIRQSAEDATRVGDEGASALEGVDTGFAF